jgi:[acyl-carrier-protein] S-malonyltransferase
MTSELAFIFPGQGSQKIGMLNDFAEDNKIIAETFDVASNVLGYDLWELAQSGTQEQINLTETTQPLLLTASIALWKLWRDKGGIDPSHLAGHSLGEWSALVCADVLEFSDAVEIVKQRGALMQSAVPVGKGAMAAIIGLEDDDILHVCQDAQKTSEGEVSAVNFNAPGQVVIAGSFNAVECAVELCKSAGAKRALPLPVSAPFHTMMMKPAADGLRDQVERTKFFPPKIPVIHNVHAKQEMDPENIKSLMLEQIYSPVLWVRCISELCDLGAQTFVECGPGKVLGGLNKRINRSLISFPLDNSANFESTFAAMQE